ncbi:MAG TPA: hypothetical protein PKC21_04665 [Oligoflexia bacterium]|nr:hypothetical protein [Oligoflexia bacterium]HMR24629.1 hypothetical protein [Oligoflexia bacterium]
MRTFLTIFLSIWFATCSSGSSPSPAQNNNKSSKKTLPSTQTLNNTLNKTSNNEPIESFDGAYLQEYLNFNTDSEHELCQTVSQFFKASIPNFPVNSSLVLECKNTQSKLECKGDTAQYLGSVNNDGQYKLQIDKNIRVILGHTLDQFIQDNELDEGTTLSKIKEDSLQGKFPKTASETGIEQFNFTITQAEQANIQCAIKAEYTLKKLEEDERIALTEPIEKDLEKIEQDLDFSGLYHVILTSNLKTENNHPICELANIMAKAEENDDDTERVVDVFVCSQKGSNIVCTSDDSDQPITGTITATGEFKMVQSPPDSDQEGVSMLPLNYIGIFPQLGQENQMQSNSATVFELSPEKWAEQIDAFKTGKEDLKKQGVSDQLIEAISNLDPANLKRIECKLTAEFKLKKFSEEEVFQRKVQYREYNKPLTYQLTVLTGDQNDASDDMFPPCQDINQYLKLNLQQDLKFNCPQGTQAKCMGFGSEFDILTNYDDAPIETSYFDYAPEEDLLINGRAWSVSAKMYYPENNPRANHAHLLLVAGSYNTDQNQRKHCSSQFEVAFKILQ